MRTGELRHRVTLQEPTEGTADSYGATTASWSDVATNVRAEVRTLSAGEAMRAAQVYPEATVQVTLRTKRSLDSSWRIVHGTRTLAIDAVLPPVRSFEDQVCMCHEEL